MTDRMSPATRAASALLRMPEPMINRLIGSKPVELDGRTLNRRLQFMLEMSAKAGMDRASRPQSIEERRNDLLRASALAMPSRQGLHVTNRHVPGPAGNIPVRLYRRYGLTDECPAIVYLHGGGWATGNLDSHDGSCRLLASESDCLVISVDYRLAPEHPFPAAIDDAVAAYRWSHQNSAELSIEPGRIGVMGDSAGGNIAAVIAQVTRDTDVPPPTAQCLIYPGTDMLMREPSHRLFADGFFLTNDAMKWYRDQYLPDTSDWTSPLASPIEQDDLSGIAPAFIVTAGFDPLRDEGRRYGERLAEAGVPVRYRCYDDMVHGFFGMGILPGGMEICSEICFAMGSLMNDTP
ncbi:MAG TPA: alpha/beta hydrolase [Microthrixaceae bacterium]|nr:alpha/beta hydrolase [Microthrixaceae bacterium]